ncbi:hypothetical protein F2Q70_00009655 [Brassica cretica]|uniref:Anaphase-promoting complex subunit 11 RING-H2 finger domain-containing protein n=1 Tax=Brassica cretica TaxID=69181 RepID=A0A8S9LVR9_BRACR|nr:hypothetical protein F2Q70_00009655 [Brassica cretica]KAF3550852.1 hypothetical protein DY000_02003675 [Brassica cretica]
MQLLHGHGVLKTKHVGYVGWLLMVVAPDCKPFCYGVRAVWGACNHAFHLHCILKWVSSQTSQAHCHMCRREWQFKKGFVLSALG